MKQREIKFRGKRIDNGVWIYGFIWQKLNPHKVEKEYLEKVFMQTGVNIDVWHEVLPETVCQFTGLTDKNGVEIYEGDVLKVCYYPLGAPKSVEYYRIGVATWPNGVMWKLDGLNVLDKEKASEWYSDMKERYKHPTQGYDWVDYQVWFHRSEVIGNIFENPEMIEV